MNLQELNDTLAADMIRESKNFVVGEYFWTLSEITVLKLRVEEVVGDFVISKGKRYPMEECFTTPNFLTKPLMDNFEYKVFRALRPINEEYSRALSIIRQYLSDQIPPEYKSHEITS